MSQFGRRGRFGNQILQRAGMYLLGKRHNATVQLRPWVGNVLFGNHDEPLEEVFPQYHERTDEAGQPIPPAGEEMLNSDYIGYGQFQTSWFSPDRDFVRSLFQPTPEVEDRLRPAVERMGGGTRVGIHLRRGDYGQNEFFIVPVGWYLELLESLWPTLDNPTLFIATEDASLVGAFDSYKPKTAEFLGVNLIAEPLVNYNYETRDVVSLDARQLDFYPDFHLLRNCDVILAPNSTFSFTAAMLNPNLRAFYRAHLPTQRFDKLDVWNAYPLEHHRVQDYSHVEGVAVASNPYWQ